MTVSSPQTERPWKPVSGANVGRRVGNRAFPMMAHAQGTIVMTSSLGAVACCRGSDGC